MKIEKAIETIKMENELMQFDLMTGEDYPIELQNQDNQDLYNANLVVISALEKLSASGWISVSERLPEEVGFYIFQLNDERIHEYYYANETLYGDCDGQFDEPIDEVAFSLDEVIAWQPLPPAYREADNENI